MSNLIVSCAEFQGDGSESQASTDGKDSKDKDTEDMKQSDGKKANGSQDPPPQYADMAGQAPIQSGPTPPGVRTVKILLIAMPATRNASL